MSEHRLAIQPDGQINSFSEGPDIILDLLEKRLAEAEVAEQKARYEWEAARGAVSAWRQAVRVVRG